LSSPVVAPKGSKPMRIRYSIEVDCPPELLWTYLEDPAKLLLWKKGFESIEPQGDDPRGLGSISIQRTGGGGKVAEYQSQLTAREPFEHLAIVMTGQNLGKSEMHVDYRLTDLGRKTQLDYLFSWEVANPFVSLMIDLFSFLIKKHHGGGLKTLKRLAEEEAGTALART
jgi:hypothetical protein